MALTVLNVFGALCSLAVAIVLLNPGLPIELVPEWGASPSVNQVVAAFLILLILNAVLQELARRFATSGPMPLVTTFAGQPATLVKRGAILFATQMTALIGIALALGALAWLGFRAGNVAVALLLALLAVWSGGVALPLVLGRYTTGGVWLTPTGFTDRFRGIKVAFAWDDVAGAEFGVPDTVAWFGLTALPVVVRPLRAGAYAVRYFAWIWRNPRKPTMDSVFLDTRELGVNPGTLVQVIVHYARDPSRRHELGTESSLATIAALHDSSGVERGYLPVFPNPLQPQPHPPPPEYPTLPSG